MLCSVTFSEKLTAYEIMWGKKFVEPGRPQMNIRRILFAYWIPKAKKHTKNM
jgi:hypothetical protein